ncbi:MAG: A24 family peptidase [Synergistaceae bacterium]|jgi:leader peptidase (prepilin peptidase)/N-methyltransferase|nr:A24 family peptidase [Synergistaceae bacterium]
MNNANLYSQIQSVLAICSVFFVGACVGSFITAVAMRTVAEKKWWGSERSACDKCGAILKALDLVPILSFLILRGKCRYCGAPIGRRHLASELISSVLASALYVRWGFSPAFGVSLLVLWFSLFNSLTDIENGYIYDVWAVALGLIGILARISGGLPAVVDGVIGAALGFGFIAIIILVSRGGMGWGDAMLMLGVGGAVGWKFCALSLYTGFMVGGVIVLPLMMAKKLKRKDAIPLGPFLAAGSVMVLFAGGAMLSRLSAFFGAYHGWPWGL